MADLGILQELQRLGIQKNVEIKRNQNILESLEQLNVDIPNNHQILREHFINAISQQRQPRNPQHEQTVQNSEVLRKVNTFAEHYVNFDFQWKNELSLNQFSQESEFKQQPRLFNYKR